MEHKLIDRSKILKKFKTGTVVALKKTSSLPSHYGAIQLVYDMAFDLKVVDLLNISSNLIHCVGYEFFKEHFEVAPPIAQTLYGIKRKKTY